MEIAIAVPEGHVTKPVLDGALEGVTRLNESLLEAGTVPTFREVVHQVRWRPEPPGAERFDHAAKVLGRGHGDCDDLAPWHAASLRVTGEDPGANAVVYQSGPKRWHAVVQRSDGRIEDPSREAGMGSGVSGVAGAVFAPMHHAAVVGGAYVVRPELAVRPTGRGGWEARVDIPWNWTPGESPADVALTTLHQTPVAAQAVVGACRAAVRLGEESGYAFDEHLDRVDCLADAIEGWDFQDLAEVYGDEEAEEVLGIVGSLFGGIANIARKVASNPLVQTASTFVPGVGPGAAAAMRYATDQNMRRQVANFASNPLVQRGISFVPGAGPAVSEAMRMASPALRYAAQMGTRPPGVPGMPGMPGAPPGMGGGVRMYCIPM
jgi:hypothetical protein